MAVKNYSPQSPGGREGKGIKTIQPPPQSTYGREGNPYVKVAQEKLTAQGSVIPVTSSIIPVTGQNQQSELDTLLSAMQQKTYQRNTFNVARPTQKLSAADRAAQLVNAQFGGKAEGINKRIGLLDKQLQQGQQTQIAYGGIGDQKLQEIYGGLTNIAKETAANTTGLYDKAATSVGQAFTSAQDTQKAAAEASVANVANDAKALGLNAAIPEATQAVNETIKATSDATSQAKAESLANIISLGANMGAAALKEVNTIATLGANTRKDLVNSVQATIAALQQDHDNATAELQIQLQELEAQRSATLQQATSQFEIDDADKQYQFDIAKLKFDTDERNQELEFERSNLNDLLTVIKYNDGQKQQSFENDVTKQGLDIQRGVQKQNILNDERNWELQAKQFGLDTEKFKQQKINDQFNQYLASTNQQLDYSKLTLDQKQAAANEWYQKQQVALASGQNATDAAYKMASIEADKAKISADQLQYEDKVKNDAAAATAKAALDAERIAKDKALVEKYKADTDLAKSRKTALENKKDASFGKGPSGYASFSKSYPKSVKSADAIIKDVAANPQPTSLYGSLYDQTLAAALSLDPPASARTLQAIQIWYGK